MGFWQKVFGRSDSASTEAETKKAGKEPWADLQFTNGKLIVVDFNEAFVANLRTKLGDLIDENMTDEDIVKLYVDRENLEREDPRLEVVQLGIEGDGQLKIKLDWNKAFIDHLRKNGITGETEDDAIKEYLSRLTTATADAEGELPDVLSRDQINEAFKDIDNVAQRELDEAAAQIKTTKRRKRKMT
jgi:outer membrane protein assembly factor BamA